MFKFSFFCLFRPFGLGAWIRNARNDSPLCAWASGPFGAREQAPQTAAVLLGQRRRNAASEFPFHVQMTMALFNLIIQVQTWALLSLERIHSLNEPFFKTWFPRDFKLNSMSVTITKYSQNMGYLKKGTLYTFYLLKLLNNRELWFLRAICLTVDYLKSYPF